MSEIRIGSGVEGAPRVPPPLKPQQPRPNPSVFLVAIAAVVLIAAGVATGAYLMGRTDARAQDLTPPAPSLTVVQLDEESTCRTLFPLLVEAKDHIVAIVEQPNGSTIKPEDVQSTLVGLEALQPGAPEGMRVDIQAHITTLKQLYYILTSSTDPVLRLEEIRASGIRLASACRRYAS